MTAFVAAGRRVLPRGWGDLFRQLTIWFGFLLVYQIARGIADRNPTRAFNNGLKVIDIERHANALYELSFQRIADSSSFVTSAAAWTYWNSEFTVIGVALLFVYLRRHEAFTKFRNTLLLANGIGLVGYVLLPTAPPRMFPDLGFADTLENFGTLNHGDGLISFAANPYAAMPSLHAADALIVGLVLAGLCRRRAYKVLWCVWPLWVWFSVMATGNHFWLDVVAGIFVAAIALWVVYRRDLRSEPAVSTA
ncbi:MAG: phosphatase PAP2 family protein [Actinomycetota bacterium]|nr:phosphatase PAP2 family protein [Actinomycetota bacterium]